MQLFSQLTTRGNAKAAPPLILTKSERKKEEERKEEERKEEKKHKKKKLNKKKKEYSENEGIPKKPSSNELLNEMNEVGKTGHDVPDSKPINGNTGMKVEEKGI